MEKFKWYQNPSDGTLKPSGTYTAEKDKIMECTTEYFIQDLRSKLNDLRYKHVNNTRLFDSEADYVKFCQAKIRATVLKMISADLELESA